MVYLRNIFAIEICLLLLLIFISPLKTNAQDEAEKLSLDNGTLSQQFDYVMEESNRYQDYKVVKIEFLNKLKSHVLDSLKAVRKELASAREMIANQKNDILQLQADLKDVNDRLNAVNTEKDNIDFLGVPMKKGGYKSIMWVIIAVLLTLLLFFIYQFNRSNVVTVQTKKALTETQEEFEAHRKNAREREQKLKRELQDELNKRL
jgi:septal ring factor EnvC (AmiA/AmiB activator)